MFQIADLRSVCSLVGLLLYGSSGVLDSAHEVRGEWLIGLLCLLSLLSSLFGSSVGCADYDILCFAETASYDISGCRCRCGRELASLV